MAAPQHPTRRPPASIWGARPEDLDGRRGSALVDAAIVVGLAGLLLGLTQVAGEWTGARRASVEIDLSPSALPRYAFFSLCRGVFAYLISLGFTLVYGYWAARDRVAERVLIPLLDVLQSIPVLGFMPGLVLSLVALFPSSNLGLELSAVLMMFTGQAWNLTFSFYNSLRTVPREQAEVATLYRFDTWQRLRWVELPFATTGLVWNSMMSMAGGWFFLMINEAFVLGDKDFRLPGLGSYMSVAAARGDTRAMVWAMATMGAMIVLLDQLVWRPLVVWAQKFRVEEGGAQEAMSSWFFEVIRRSRLILALRRALRRLGAGSGRPSPRARPSRVDSHLPAALSVGLLVGLALGLAFGIFGLAGLVRSVTLAAWAALFGSGLLTLGRVLLATALATLWALPAGLAIGLSPRLSRLFQPVVQLLASFPAPMLFPAVIFALEAARIPLGWGSVLLMLLGTQWYVLFNVIAGAVAIPADLREAARSYRLRPSQRFFRLYVPAIFPYLVTGWVTATGGAWNASVVAEFVTLHGRALATRGLGAEITGAAARAELSRLAAAVAVMSLIVVAFNRTVWQACYRLADRRLSLGA